MLLRQNRYVDQLRERLAAAQTWRKRAHTNRWILLGRQIPWAVLEERYARLFPEIDGTKRPVQLAVGIMLAQSQLGVDDEEMLFQLAENPFLRIFVGLPADDEVHLPTDFVAYCRSKLTEPVMQEIAALLQEPEGLKRKK